MSITAGAARAQLITEVATYSAANPVSYAARDASAARAVLARLAQDFAAPAPVCEVISIREVAAISNEGDTTYGA